jgi:methionyl-tRNA synthetase
MIIQSLIPSEITNEYGINIRRVYPHKGIMENPPFGSSWGIIEPKGSTTPHSHHELETFYIVEGEGEMTIDGDTSIVKAGDTIYIPAFTTHQLRNLQDKELRFIAIWWEKEGE